MSVFLSKKESSCGIVRKVLLFMNLCWSTRVIMKVRGILTLLFVLMKAISRKKSLQSATRSACRLAWRFSLASFAISWLIVLRRIFGLRSPPSLCNHAPLTGNWSRWPFCALSCQHSKKPKQDDVLGHCTLDLVALMSKGEDVWLPLNESEVSITGS